tara:strand:- start:335 stop:460 length:126 start_codon:yes stop_codon:yes gene_type:complete
MGLDIEHFCKLVSSKRKSEKYAVGAFYGGKLLSAGLNKPPS